MEGGVSIPTITVYGMEEPQGWNGMGEWNGKPKGTRDRESQVGPKT